jgi:hypothetical protein
MNLKTGTYHANGSMFARSCRVVVNQNGRICIKIVAGPPNPHEGFQHITSAAYLRAMTAFL